MWIVILVAVVAVLLILYIKFYISYLRQLIEQMIDGGGQNGRTQFQLIWKIIQIISYD